ncbi:hypothetical protein JOQ06_006595, partial [Pogonophryne albipinna]
GLQAVISDQLPGFSDHCLSVPTTVQDRRRPVLDRRWYTQAMIRESCFNKEFLVSPWALAG